MPTASCTSSYVITKHSVRMIIALLVCVAMHTRMSSLLYGWLTKFNTLCVFVQTCVQSPVGIIIIVDIVVMHHIREQYTNTRKHVRVKFMQGYSTHQNRIKFGQEQCRFDNLCRTLIHSLYFVYSVNVCCFLFCTRFDPHMCVYAAHSTLERCIMNMHMHMHTLHVRHAHKHAHARIHAKSNSHKL